MTHSLESARGPLQQVALDLVRSAPPEEAPLLAWPLVCGARTAGRTRAVAFTAGVLRVEVPDATWRAQLGDLAPRYLSTLRQLLPGCVTRIEFVLAGAA